VKEQKRDKISAVNRVVAGLALLYGLLFMFLLFGSYVFGWAWTGFPTKTLWDWMQLLLAVAVPALIGVYGSTISRLQYAGQREAEQRRGQAEALQAYLDQMGQMLLDKDRSLRQSKEGDEVRTLARAWTLTVLNRMDGDGKATVLQFLYESGLNSKDKGIVDLRSADLSGAILVGAVLIGAKLNGAVLTGADLSKASLSNSDLRGANLSNANLSSAILVDADLGILDPVALDPYPIYKRSVTDLSETNLRNAVLIGADLSGANLKRADLSGASVVHPRAAPSEELRKLIDKEQGLSRTVAVNNLWLEYMTESLEGATMPNGQKYEVWLKGRKRYKEDGQNSGP
jgi:hypothetical protein